MSTRTQALKLIEALLKDKVIDINDLRRFIPSSYDECNPEYLRVNLERWFIQLGIEQIIGDSFSLSECPFTRQEIEKARAMDQVILCVPKNVAKKQLGELFRLNSWALSDPLVGGSCEMQDFWFKTSKSSQPPYVGKSAKEVRAIFEDKSLIGFSLERYLIFIGWMRTFENVQPDYKWWTWILSSKYDKSSYLIAGFDANKSLSIHGWKSTFSAEFVGTRFIELPRNTL